MPRVTMPQLGESVAEGTIGRWLKKPGDHVAKYEPLVEVITDKVNAEVPSPFEGTLTEILVQEGETVPNNTEIAIVEAAGEGSSTEARASEQANEQAKATEPTVLGTGGFGPAGSDERPADERPAEGSPAARPPRADQPLAPAATADRPVDGNGATAPDGYTGRMTPAVRRLAREHGVDLALIAGSGHAGRVTRDDVMRFVESGGAAGQPASPMTTPMQGEASPAPPAANAAAPARTVAPAPIPGAAPAASPAPALAPAPTVQAQDELKPTTPMRRSIAEHMVRSTSSVPHAYTTVEVDMSGVVALRDAVKGRYQAQEGIALSFVAIVGKAVVEGLRRNPDLNAHWTDQGLLRKANVNLGIAVAVDDGLIVPVIKDADRYSIHGLNLWIQDLATRARARKLRLDDIEGGTFTLNNTGWFGSVASQPIINIPQVAILSMEAIVKRPVVVETPAGDTIGIRPIMNLCVALDHRATDGAQVGLFIQDVKRWLEAAGPDTPVW